MKCLALPRFSLTGRKMKFFIKYFFSKSDEIRSFLPIWSHLLKKSLMKNLVFCAVTLPDVTLPLEY